MDKRLGTDPANYSPNPGAGRTFNMTVGHTNHASTPLPKETEQLVREREEAKHHKTLVQETKAQVETEGNGNGSGKRRSIVDVLHLPHMHHKEGGKEKRKSISDSGPFVVEKNPVTGNYITKPNPHWPEEDSGTRENVRSGKGDSDVIVPGGMGNMSYY